MVKIYCEGESSIEVLSHIKGLASLVSAEVPTNTGTMPESVVANAAPIHTSVPTATPPQPPVSVPTPAAPVNYTVPAPQTAPVNYTAPAPQQPPVTQPPAYTCEQVGKAGADLVTANPNIMPTMMSLMQRYGVQIVTDLKPEQLGPFAGELRALGAKI